MAGPLDLTIGINLKTCLAYFENLDCFLLTTFSAAPPLAKPLPFSIMFSSLLLAALSGAVAATSFSNPGNLTLKYLVSLPTLSSGTECACNQLFNRFGNALLNMDSNDYTTQAQDFYDIRAALEPRCIFMPTDAQQVASGMSILASCGAQFAIRGGGHMNVSNHCHCCCSLVLVGC